MPLSPLLVLFLSQAFVRPDFSFGRSLFEQFFFTLFFHPMKLAGLKGWKMPRWELVLQGGKELI